MELAEQPYVATFAISIFESVWRKGWSKKAVFCLSLAVMVVSGEQDRRSVQVRWVRDNKRAVYNWTKITYLNTGSQTMTVACWAEQ